MKKKILHRDYNTEKKKNKQWFLIKLFWPEHGFYNDTFQPWQSKTGVSVVIAKLYALGCICIKGELLSLPKVIFLLGNDTISGCLAFANFVGISPDSLTVSTNPAQSIQEEQTMTNIQREIKAKCQNLGTMTKSRPWTSCIR